MVLSVVGQIYVLWSSHYTQFIGLKVDSSSNLISSSPPPPFPTIGNLSYDQLIGFSHRIDVVYTWVNGSDPIWLKDKIYWENKLKQNQFENHQTSKKEKEDERGNINNDDENENMREEDDNTGSNRYRDNDELRYSLRFLITNGRRE